MTRIELRYHVLDVFAERGLEGNPLTVVDVQSPLPTSLMQAIAKETNHSETTFIVGPEGDNGHPVRIFTPNSELPFAGHPTLGTAWLLGQEHGFPIALDLPAGRVPLALEDGRLTMRQPVPTWIAEVDADLMAASLGVPVEGPCQHLSAGAPAILVPVTDSHKVRSAQFDARRYLEAGGKEVTGVYVFTTNPDHPELDIHARFFAEFVGISEDPATGSAVGLLAAWLTRNRPEFASRMLTVGQGIEMGRPSRLYARGSETDGKLEIHVGGSVVRVAQGTFYIELDERFDDDAA